MKVIQLIASSIFLACSVSSAFADFTTPEHRCIEPVLDNQGDQYSAAIKKLQIDDYRSCIEHFVDEQKTAMDLHRQAADSAIKEWNGFVDRQSRSAR